MTLAFVLKGFAPTKLARALRVGPADTEKIVAFHHRLLERITALARPE